ncbi:inositol monophosphatase family protein [Kozakia baliensis]|uniref:Histidinol phosphate phosphatase n=1 Tax=Kozakia baliensis TaxID=153496 RepID=A0A1D8UTT9_9PROT|nr:inositol monophosphatase family protein [Kozakia baliensis]AOX17062.1 histidinol phosphate phosphatase [Kozakia baliensis]GBR25006.1 inositol monophosphatase [Kozakia baliensis NRIC 0488]GEL63874.1 histidinol-phosphatase [Kozakia baliensis]
MTVPALSSDVVETATLCAEIARVQIRPHFRKPIGIENKEDASPVTLADRAAEQAMRDIISQNHPDHGILGEEYGQSAGQGDWTWVLDPIDGTRAFITGRPSFTTLIALLYCGRPVLSLIDQPLTGERWLGRAGAPTCFEGASFPGQVGTRACGSLAEAELSCTSPDMLIPPFDGRFASLKQKVRRTSWGGDAYGYGLLALGQIDLIAECTMKPWDWAALVPIIEGAGGFISDWQGNPLTLDSDGTVLACGSLSLQEEAVSALRASF